VRRGLYALIAIAILAFIAGFPAYMAFGQGGGGGGNHASVTVTATPEIVSAPPGGGGGGGGGGEETPVVQKCPAGEVYAAEQSNYLGLVFKTVIVESYDGRFQLTIAQGITALTRAGLPLGCIGIHEMEETPSLPAGAYLISAMYNAVPDRATFSPPAIIQYSYDPAAIPTDVDEHRLVIAYRDETSGQWTQLNSIVDTQAHTVTAAISHFSDLAVFGFKAEAPPPATFQVSSLNISPGAVYTGEAVTITALVTNTGGQPAGYQVVLNINGATEKTREVTIDPGASTEVSFNVIEEAAGMYSVDINGATGNFVVNSRPPAPKPFPWWIVAVAIAGALLASLLTYAFRSQKKYGGVTGALSAPIGKAFSETPKLASKAVAAISSLFKQTKRGKKK
jgi:hypothetical protein